MNHFECNRGFICLLHIQNLCLLQIILNVIGDLFSTCANNAHTGWIILNVTLDNGMHIQNLCLLQIIAKCQEEFIFDIVLLVYVTA